MSLVRYTKRQSRTFVTVKFMCWKNLFFFHIDLKSTKCEARLGERGARATEHDLITFPDKITMCMSWKCRPRNSKNRIWHVLIPISWAGREKLIFALCINKWITTRFRFSSVVSSAFADLFQFQWINERGYRRDFLTKTYVYIELQQILILFKLV